MKKVILGFLLMALVLVGSSPAFASLNDNRNTIASQYGDIRMVIDTHHQLWAKADWDTKGKERAVAETYIYYFERQGLRMEMDVRYDGTNPESKVYAQRFSPDMPIQIKDFKAYFPEIYAMVASPDVQLFATTQKLSNHFREETSPYKMGVLIGNQAEVNKTGFYTLVAFNIQDEGRYVNDMKFINKDTYIREFTIERVYRGTVNDNLITGNKKWLVMDNLFSAK